MTILFSRVFPAFSFLLTFTILIFVPTNDAAHAANADARLSGAVVFQTKGCERCHAIFGVGGDRAPDLGMIGQRKTASQIRTQIVNGGHGMPPFGKVLSKGEVKDVVVFLASCKTEAAPGCRQWMQPEAVPGQNQ
jgi:mono/diheme cytochrome c family protein